MPYIITIEDDEHLELLRRVVNNLYVKMNDNKSGYVEYLDAIESIKNSFDNASIEKDVIIEIVGKPLIINANIEKNEKSSSTKKTKTANVNKVAKKSVSAIAKLPSYCDNHPKYGAQRAPRTDCENCWNAYKNLNPTKYQLAYRKFLRNQNSDN